MKNKCQKNWKKIARFVKKFGGFDPAIFSFRALLENNQKSMQNLQSEKVQNHFLSLEFCQLTHLQDIKFFVGQK